MVCIVVSKSLYNFVWPGYSPPQSKAKSFWNAQVGYHSLFLWRWGISPKLENNRRTIQYFAGSLYLTLKARDLALVRILPYLLLLAHWGFIGCIWWSHRSVGRTLSSFCWILSSTPLPLSSRGLGLRVRGTIRLSSCTPPARGLQWYFGVVQSRPKFHLRSSSYSNQPLWRSWTLQS